MCCSGGGALFSGKDSISRVSEVSGVPYGRLSACFDLCRLTGGISPGDKERRECLRLCL